VVVAGCRGGADGPGSDESLVAPVVVSAVVPHRFVETVEGSGVIAALPENVHVVTPLYAGRVTRLVTHVGASVVARDPLCEIALDPVAAAEIEKLRRGLALAERTLERQRRAVDAGVSPRVALEQAELEAGNARAEYVARTRDYDAGSQRLILRAPIAGLVTAVDVHIGQEVDGATKAVTIIDPDALAANVRFDAAVSVRIQVGQKGTLVPLQPGGAPLRAIVIRMGPVLDPTSQRADGWLRPEGDPPAPGTYVRATVEVGVTDGVAVPRAALVKTDHGYRVFVLDGTVAHARDVTVGTVEGDLAEIRDGLVAGEEVASGGAQELADGVRISVQDSGS
jgi:RND family efflux transporter MFP subunit